MPVVSHFINRLPLKALLQGHRKQFLIGGEDRRNGIHTDRARFFMPSDI